MRGARKKSIFLIGVGVASMIAGVFFTIEDAKKEAIEEDGIGFIEDEKKINTVKRRVKRYWKPLALFTLSITCFISANHLALKAASAATLAYKVMDERNKKIIDRLEEGLTDHKKTMMRHELFSQYMNEPEFDKAKVVKVSGPSLFYDVLSKQKFYDSMSHLRDIEIALNEQMGRTKDKDAFIPCVRMYEKLRVKGFKGCEHVGWNKSDGKIAFGYHPAVLDSGEVCTVLLFRVAPHY